ncbi:uncharacterized protein LOC106459217 [Limulus polyphemus]|uniref:Uncharacterized protein LOC106459217 n=1 Tax=Limulus polyphemus TaxID=6850 RepID=A0ABM1SCL3_LIMPO|nr:uncharacterized protein LOC106459217 [Limulus polyphemus]
MDATGKIPSGILRGSLSALGDFDQCLNINVNTSNLSFRGKYCSIEFKPLMPPRPRIFQKILPLFDNFTSSDKGLDKIMETPKLFNSKFVLFLSLSLPYVFLSVASRIHVEASVINCNVKETPMLEKDQIAVIIFLLVVGMITVIATITDVCTSLPNNGKQLEKLRRNEVFRARMLVSSVLAQPLKHGTVVMDTFFALRSSKKGLLTILVLVLVSSAVTGVVIEYFKLPAARYFTDIDSRDLWKLINFVYVQPYPHLGSYFVGAATGYLVVKQPVIKLSKVQQLFGWLFFVLIIVGVLYGTLSWTKGEETGRVAVVLYAVSYSTLWAIAIAWLIVACLYGYGGMINTFLSSSYFIKLDRLSYAVYLIHVPVHMIYFYQKIHTTSFQGLELVYMFFGTVMMIYPLAFLFTVLFESPYIALIKTMIIIPEGGSSSDPCVIQNCKEEKTLPFKKADCNTNKSI